MHKGNLTPKVIALIGLLVFSHYASGQGEQPTRTEFEAGLQQFPTGYLLYVKLDEKGKQSVYEEFLKTEESKRYAAAIKKTLELGIR